MAFLLALAPEEAVNTPINPLLFIGASPGATQKGVANKKAWLPYKTLKTTALVSKHAIRYKSFVRVLYFFQFRSQLQSLKYEIAMPFVREG